MELTEVYEWGREPLGSILYLGDKKQTVQHLKGLSEPELLWLVTAALRGHCTEDLQKMPDATFWRLMSHRLHRVLRRLEEYRCR